LKNLIIALILTPIVATLVGALFALLAMLIVIMGVAAMFMTPINIMKHLEQQDEDRRKLTQ
jgi:hypothetical protein